jgi:hypothetical protein
VLGSGLRAVVRGHSAPTLRLTAMSLARALSMLTRIADRSIVLSCSLPLSRSSVMESDAAAAVRKYSGKPFKGSRVLIEVAKPRLRDEKEKRQPKSAPSPTRVHSSCVPMRAPLGFVPY